MFLLLTDAQMNGRYEVPIHMAKVVQVSLPPVADR